MSTTSAPKIINLYPSLDNIHSFIHFISPLLKYKNRSLQNTKKWGVVAERSSLPDSSSGVSSRMWVRIPAVTLVSLSKTLNHNCFSPPRG